MRKILLSLTLCLLGSSTLSYALTDDRQLDDLTFMLSHDLAQQLGAQSSFRHDVILLKDGSILKGNIVSLPSLDMDLGVLPLLLSDMGGIVVEEKDDLMRCQYITRLGEDFIGKPVEPSLKIKKLMRGDNIDPFDDWYEETFISFSQIKMILFKPRGIAPPKNLKDDEYSLILRRGDKMLCRPITCDLRVSYGEGLNEGRLPLSKISDVWFMGNQVAGHLRTEALDRKIQGCTLLDKTLRIVLSRTGQFLDIPFSQILRLKHDGGALIEQSPYDLPVHWNKKIEGMILIEKGESIVDLDSGQKEERDHDRYFDQKPTLLKWVKLSEEKTENKDIFVCQEPRFYIDRHLVSNRDYVRFIQETSYKMPDHWQGSCPQVLDEAVTGVSFEDAQAFASWSGKELPTLSQWVHAMRLEKENLDPNLKGEKFFWELCTLPLELMKQSCFKSDSEEQPHYSLVREEKQEGVGVCVVPIMSHDGENNIGFRCVVKE